MKPDPDVIRTRSLLIRGVLGSIFAQYVPLASQHPYPIIVYSVANYRPHLSQLWANVIFAPGQLSHVLFMPLPYRAF